MSWPPWILFSAVDYGQTIDVAPGIRATFHDAGHILGSAIIVLDVEEGGEPARRIVFSGDLGRPGTPIIRDPTAIIDGADYVVTESTYGGREHEPADEAVRMLADIVREVSAHKGVLLIPAFAVGRTQEIVWHLDRLLSAGDIPHVPLYLDSPMASLASDIYRRYPGYYDEETFGLLQAGETPLDYPDARVTNDVEDSRAIARAPRPMVIVASSGMLTGGRIVNHLRELIDDPDALLLFVGYQGEGTLGAHLQSGAQASPHRRGRTRGALPDPLHQRVLSPRRRVRAARLAGLTSPVHRASQRRSSWSMATPRPSMPWSRRSAPWVCDPTARPGARRSTSAEGLGEGRVLASGLLRDGLAAEASRPRR